MSFVIYSEGEAWGPEVKDTQPSPVFDMGVRDSGTNGTLPLDRHPRSYPNPEHEVLFC